VGKWEVDVYTRSGEVRKTGREKDVLGYCRGRSRRTLVEEERGKRKARRGVRGTERLRLLMVVMEGGKEGRRILELESKEREEGARSRKK